MIIKNKKLFISIISLTLSLGFIATIMVSYFVSINALRKVITQENLPLTSDNIYSEIQRDLLRPIFISSLMASDTFLRDWVINGERDTAKISRYLKEIQMKYNTFTCFFVSEKSRIYYYSGGILKKVKPAEERDAWYFRVREMKDDKEINVDPDMANKDTMTIFINYRVYDYNANYIGATGVGLAVRSVKNLINNYQIRYQRNILFIDTTGLVKLCSNLYPYEGKNIKDIEGLNTIADKILPATIQSLQYTLNGEEVFLNVRYIPEFDWYLLVEQTETKSIENIRKTLLVNVLIGLIITTIIIIMANFFINMYQKQLEKMAITDKLTNLHNRNAFDLVFNQILKDIKRRKEHLSVLMLDIDHFKKINDTYGHLAGDEALKNISETLLLSIRESDVVFRWGGEEFLIFLSGCDLSSACITAENIRKSINEHLFKFQKSEVLLTVSIGVTQYNKSDTSDSLIGRVDKLLYTAKNNGRNRVENGML